MKNENMHINKHLPLISHLLNKPRSEMLWKEFFLLRDAMRKRGLCCRPVSVRPSIRLSVTLVYCIQTAEDIVKLLSRPGSAIILVL